MIPPGTLEKYWNRAARAGTAIFGLLRLSPLAKGLLGLFALALAVISLWPGTAGLVGKYDKLVHALVYGLLALAGLVLARDARSRSILLLGVVLLGLAIEVLQVFKPDGEVSLADLDANLWGVGIAVILWVIGRLAWSRIRHFRK